MAKPIILFCLLALFCFALTSDAATYAVGDTSGWDISTNIDSWVSDKSFKVGDVLSFQYSSSHSVNEVKKENFESCNTTNALGTFSNGNSTITLSRGGSRYFICGNKLHCLGGMKLQVNVEGDEASTTGVDAPQAQPDNTLPQPSSKSNNPSTVIPTSAGFVGGGIGSLFIGFISLTITTLILECI